ncbi:MAG: tetratricopeptide repeat protein [Leptolyngbyaceae cyanobacterium]
MVRKSRQGLSWAVLGLITIGPLVSLGGRSPQTQALPQPADVSPFPIAQTFLANLQLSRPEVVAPGTVVRIDGSDTMVVVNDQLKQGFESAYADTQIELSNNGAQAALEALAWGDIDLAAIGRQLTLDERNQGMVQVTLKREKIAVIVGPDNPFDGDLTLTQFAQIFRGEITNWAEVGGESRPIRFIDRPNDADVRLALQEYDTFKSAQFASGPTTVRVTEDDTNAVIAELGRDGIGYAPTSHVLNLDTVRLVSMHNVLPTSPTYPYSQARAYVYFSQPSEAAIAFLGYGASADGQANIQSALTAETEAIATGFPIASAVASPPEEAAASGGTEGDIPSNSSVEPTSSAPDSERVGTSPTVSSDGEPPPEPNSSLTVTRSDDDRERESEVQGVDDSPAENAPPALPLWFWFILPVAVLALLLWKLLGGTSNTTTDENDAEADGPTSNVPAPEISPSDVSSPEATGLLPPEPDGAVIPPPPLESDWDLDNADLESADLESADLDNADLDKLELDSLELDESDLDEIALDEIHEDMEALEAIDLPADHFYGDSETLEVINTFADNSLPPPDDVVDDVADDFLNNLPEPDDEDLDLEPEFSSLLFLDTQPLLDVTLFQDDDDTSEWIARGHRLTESEQYQDADASFDHALRLQPDSGAALAGKGRVALALAKPEDAIAHFNAAVTQYPDQAILALYQGHTYAEMQQWEEALAAYDHSTNLDPNFLDATLAKGKTLATLGQAQSAIVCFNHILDTRRELKGFGQSNLAIAPSSDPSNTTNPSIASLGLPLLSPVTLNAQALQGRGNALLTQGYVGAALDNLREATETDPTNPDLWVALGHVLARLQREQEAIASFDRALALAPSHPDALQGKLAYAELADIH